MHLNILNKKSPYIAFHLIKKLSDENTKGTIKTWSRDSNILPYFLDKTIYVYNGIKHYPIRITKFFYFSNENNSPNFHKLGEFSYTRYFKSHKIIEKKIKKKKK